MVLNNGLGVFWVEGNWDLTKRQWRKSQLSMRSFLFRRMNRRGNLYAHSSHFVLYCVVKMLVKSCTFQILGLLKLKHFCWFSLLCPFHYFTLVQKLYTKSYEFMIFHMISFTKISFFAVPQKQPNPNSGTSNISDIHILQQY